MRRLGEKIGYVRFDLQDNGEKRKKKSNEHQL